MRYINFNVMIQPKTNKGYPLEAEARKEATDGKEAWSRKAYGLLQLDPDSTDVTSAIEDLVERRTNRESMVRMGTFLYEALFSGENRELRMLFDQSMGDSQEDVNEGVCLSLTIRARQIAVIPWEMLYDPVRQTFFATSIETPLMRYFDDVFIPVRPGKIEGTVRILVVIPDAPPDAPKLNTAEEEQIIRTAIKDMGDGVHIEVLKGNITPDAIYKALIQYPPHIFHFIGHGRFDEGRGYLRLPAEDMDHDRLSGLLQNSIQMKLVVLNACKGAKVSPHGPFTGLAPQLVKRGIPAVAAMQFAIFDDIAIQFCKILYHSLFKGSTDRGRIDIAITHARNELSVCHHEGRAFCAPVLFSHSQTGVVFDVPLEKPGLGARRSPKEADRLEALKQTHQYDIHRMQESSAENAKIEEAKADLKRTKKELREIKYRKVSRRAAIAIAVLVFFLYGIHWLDLFRLDTMIKNCTVSLGTRFTHTDFHDSIIIVSINKKKALQEFGRPYEESSGLWREDHAKLIDNLSKAGVKVITLDIECDLSSELASADETLRDAILSASKRGTSVIAVVSELDGGEPKMPYELSSAISGWGLSLIGTRLGYARLAPLIIRKETELKNVIYVPGLAMRTLVAYNGNENLDVVDFDQDRKYIKVRLDPKTAEPNEIGFFELDIIEQASDLPPVLDNGDAIANLAIGLTPVDTIRAESRRYSYKYIRDHANPQELTQLKDKIVIVGVEDEKDLYGDRWGFELHADTLNTLLNGVFIRPATWSWQFALIVILSISGAAIRVHTRNLSRQLGFVLLIAVLLLYFAFTIYLYTQYRILLNTAYDAVALLVAYWVVGKIERRYFQ